MNCTLVDAEAVWNVLHSSSSKATVTLTLKRRRSTAQGLYSVKLHLGRGLPHGLVLENGVYIRSIAPGSVAARDTSLKSGDRLCSINGRPVDSMTSLTEVRPSLSLFFFFFSFLILNGTVLTPLGTRTTSKKPLRHV